MHNLLTPSARPDTARRERAVPSHTQAPAAEPSGLLTAGQQSVLLDMQATLRRNGIAAETAEILQAMIDALTARPNLCKGLLAVYLLEPRA